MFNYEHSVMRESVECKQHRQHADKHSEREGGWEGEEHLGGGVPGRPLKQKGNKSSMSEVTGVALLHPPTPPRQGSSGVKQSVYVHVQLCWRNIQKAKEATMSALTVYV